MGQVLVTGGAGFIGSHLVDGLIAQGEQVRVLDDLSTGSRDNLSGAFATGHAELIVGSVTDPGMAAAASRGCERIFHLAATVGVRRVLEDPLGGLRNNILGTDAILHAARETSVSSLILFSSSEVYGQTCNGPLSESALTLIGPTEVPRWSYAAGKVVGEYLALGAYRKDGLPVTVVRCFNTCGPRQVGTYGMVVPSFLKQAMMGQSITVYGEGTQTRCFSFVGDVVRGVIALSRCDAAHGQVYNIGADDEVTIGQLAERVRLVCERRSPVAHIPYAHAYG